MQEAVSVNTDPRDLSMPQAAPLDGLRAIAVAIVFFGHSGIGGGGLGVTVFFFLSGYLITSLLRAEMAQQGRLDLRAFYLRRTLRIMPPLYISLLVAFVLWRLGWLVYPVDPLAIPAQIFFVQNYSSLWGHWDGLPLTGLWSLAVEEHFYLVFPLVFTLVLGRMAPSRAAYWCLAACLAALGMRIVNVAMLSDFSVNYQWTHTRIDSILFGSCLALWNNPLLDRDPWRPKAWQALLALAIVAFTFVYRDPVFRETIRYSIQGLALFVLFSFALQDKGRVSWALSSWPLRRVGLYSYTLYLIHNAIFVIWDHHIALRGLARTAGVLAISLAYAWLMYKFVEGPAAAMRRRLHESAIKPAL